jgi:hypothetical protein
MRGLDPLFQVLRTVPPLAWLPISLAAFRDAQPSAIFVIFITAVWPIIINTAVGIRNIPQDYRNVALILRLNQFEFFYKIMIPSAAPYIFTGLRLRRPLRLAIVAAEMLTGGVASASSFWDGTIPSRHHRAGLHRRGLLASRPHGAFISTTSPLAAPRQLRPKHHIILKIDHVDKVFSRGNRETEVLKGVTLGVERANSSASSAIPVAASPRCSTSSPA